MKRIIKENDLKEAVKEVIKELLDETISRKTVIRGGKRKKIKKDSSKNRKIVGGKSVTMGAAERIKRSRSQIKAAKKKKGKQSRINRKRNKSMKKRDRMGLR
jgi:hypothetical protein